MNCGTVVVVGDDVDDNDGGINSVAETLSCWGCCEVAERAATPVSRDERPIRRT